MTLRDAVWMGTMFLGSLATGCGHAQPQPAAAPSAIAKKHEPTAPSIAKPAPKVEAVGLVLVLDRSGSMTGEKFERAKKACIAAIHALKKEDQVAVVLFDSVAKVLVDLGAADRPDLDGLVTEMQPGGGTNIKPALEAAATLIPDGSVRFRIVLMSDGQAPTQGLDEVVNGLRHRGITLSSVALGGEADRELLKSLAEKGGGTFHDVALPAELETVFVREASDRNRPSTTP